MAVNDPPALPTQESGPGHPAPYGLSYDATHAVAVIELRGPAGGTALDAHVRSALLMAARRLTTAPNEGSGLPSRSTPGQGRESWSLAPHGTGEPTYSIA